MKLRHSGSLFFAGVLLCAIITPAQERADLQPKASTAGFRVEFLYQLDEVQKKIVDLAEAMPQEKYFWRPVEGVRAVSEVYVHIAGGNFLLPQFAGIKPPAGIS